MLHTEEARRRPLRGAPALHHPRYEPCSMTDLANYS
jgi:hypothetical protein